MDLVAVGDSLKLSLQLHDGATGKFPRAFVYDQAGAAVSGSPFALTHAANGRYTNSAFTVVSGNQRLYATFIVYNDAGFTQESLFHTRAQEVYDVETKVETVNAKIGTPVGTVSSDIAGIQTKLGTPAGASVSADIASVQSDTNDIQAKIGTPVGTLASDIASVQADTDDIQSKIGVPVGTVSSDIAAVQAKLGTPAGASVSADIASVQADTDDIQAKIGTPVGTLSSDIASVQADTDDIQSKIGVPVGTVSSDIAGIQTKLGTPAGVSVSADIASVKADSSAIKTKTDQLSFSGGRVDSVISSLQEDAIVDKTWDEVLADHNTAGSMGYNENLIDDIKSTVDNFTSADGNHSIVVPSVITLPGVGTETYRFYFRNLISGVPANPSAGPDIQIEDSAGAIILAFAAMTNQSTGVYYYDYVVNNTDPERQIIVKIRHKDGALDPYLYLFATSDITLESANTSAILAQTTAIKAKTDQLAFTGGRVDSVISSAQEDGIVDKVWDEAQAGHTSAGTFGKRLDADVSTREAESDAASRAATNQSEHDATQIAVAAVQSDVTAVKTKTDQLAFSGGRVNSVISGTQEDAIVDKVWDEPKLGHATPGTFGEYLDTTVSSRESEVSAASRAATNQAEHDATQAAITSVQADTDDIQSKIGTPVTTVSGDVAAVKSVDDAIKVKTDQLVFSGGRVESVISTAQEDSIVDKVWNEQASDHLAAGSTGLLLFNIAATADPAAIADAVWDELATGHTLPGSFGLFMDVIRQYGADTINELVSGVTGLAAIKATVQNAETNVITEVNQNETKIDAIIPAVNSARNTVLASVSGVGTQVGNLSTQLTAAEAAIIAEVNQNETKIDSVSSQVGTIQNNTTTRFIVPEQIYRPDVGSKTYEFHIRLYDTSGNPEAPDSAPTIRIRRIDTSTDIVSGAAMTQLGANVGAYYYQFTITSGTDLYQMLVEATVVEGGVTRLVPATSEIVEFQADLNAIQSDIAALDVKTTDVQSKVNNVTYGLSALHNDHTNIVNEINANETKIDLVKAKTDNLPADPASATQVAAVTTAVLTRPDLASIITQLNLIRDSIKGIDGRSNTDVYNQFDISTVAKTNDPRFSFLDAAISSRSTLAAADVWAYGTRTLSTVVLPPAEVQKIWDALTSSFLTAGSVGKLLKDNLDAAITSRASYSQVASLLTGVAQESTVLTETAQIDSTLAAMSAVLTVINNLVGLVKAKTDNLPSNPANELTVQTETAQIDAAVAAINILATAIKAKTDNLPSQPAQQGSVLAIPLNPVLATDPRLNNLDVAVSTRSILNTGDLANLASDTDLSSAVATIMSAISTVIADITTANNAIVLRPTSTQMDTKLLPVAKTTDVASATVAILAAIAGIPSGSGLTAAQVWAYATRTLTASPTDTSLLAKTADLLPLAKIQYTNRMSTVFNNISGDQELIAWAEKDGQRVVGSNCTVTVKTDAGTVLWTGTLATPNSDGIFKFINPVTTGVDKNYYVVIAITVDAAVRTTQQPFFTVG